MSAYPASGGEIGFITKELYTSKSGDVEGLSRTGAASLWLSTLDEKCEAGEIIYDLTIQDNHAADIHKPYLQLARRGGGEEALANFRAGDAVVLYERNSEQDNVTNKMVFKGNVEYISEQTIRLRLRASQQNAGVLPADSRYAVEHDYMDTTFRSMYQGLPRRGVATCCWGVVNQPLTRALTGRSVRRRTILNASP